MPFSCYRCGFTLSLERPGRRDTCPQCNSDIHSCKNCAHYDEKAYNYCKEPSAERVLDKEKSNFCDFYAVPTTQGIRSTSDPKKDALKKLDDLFKK